MEGDPSARSSSGGADGGDVAVEVDVGVDVGDVAVEVALEVAPEPVSQLPSEIVEHICDYMKPLDLIRMGGVCRHWRNVSSSDSVWKRHCSSKREYIEEISKLLVQIEEAEVKVAGRKSDYVALKTLIACCTLYCITGPFLFPLII